MNDRKASSKVSAEEFTKKINTLIDSGEHYLKKVVKNSQDLEDFADSFSNWNTYNSKYLKYVFDNGIEYIMQYNNAPCRKVPNLSSINVKYLKVKYKFLSKIKVLKELLYIADLILINSTNTNPSNNEMSNSTPDTTRVFIVHGQNDLIKEQVARTVEKLGLKAVILHEQASGGMTIIEKIEHYSDVQFAVVLLTGDDEGRKRDVTGSTKSKVALNNRARQNVILELGYFIGFLGRKKVMPLYEEGVEIPNDLAGVVYVPIDKSGTWKLTLVHELQKAGYKVDANSLLN